MVFTGMEILYEKDKYQNNDSIALTIIAALILLVFLFDHNKQQLNELESKNQESTDLTKKYEDKQQATESELRTRLINESGNYEQR